jgi:GntR family transcriptional regulator / MocR family aminotransferase
VNNSSTRVNDPLSVWEHVLRKPARQNGSLVMQLVSSFIDAIDSRQIPEGVRLPSSRAISASLNIGRNTAIAAINTLIEQGYLVAKDRSGVFVAEISRSEGARIREPRSATFDWRQRLRLVDPARIELATKTQPLITHNFKYGQFDPSTFPTNHWRQCERSATGVSEIAEWGRDAFDQDDAILVESLRRHVLPNHGIWAEPDEILVTLGGQEGRYLVVQLLSKDGVTVGYEDPGLPDTRDILALTGARQISLPIDDEGVCLSAELKQCDVAFVMPGHHCPTTAVMSAERREALLVLAKRRDMILVEDTYETELLTYGKTQPSLKSVDEEGRVIHIGSLSKSVAPGLRIGFVVASPVVIRELRSIRRLVHRHPPGNIQRALAMFIDRGYYHSYIRKVAMTSAIRAGVFKRSFGELFPSAVMKHCDGAASFWVRFEEDVDCNALCSTLEGQGVLTESGERFFREDPKRNYLRLGVSQVPSEKIATGLGIISRTLWSS